jgi:hypothetical protein
LTNFFYFDTLIIKKTFKENEMKRLVLVLILFAIIATGAVFADHPSGLGIGVQGGTSSSWEGKGHYDNGGALSLKLPSIPIFWAVRLDIYGGDFFWLNVSGDKYIYDKALVKDIGLNWYLGLGLGVGLGIGGDDLGLGVSGRLPIGLSWQPIPLLEIFLQIVPHLGVAVLPDFHFPYGGWGGDLGIRLWF